MRAIETKSPKLLVNGYANLNTEFRWLMSDHRSVNMTRTETTRQCNRDVLGEDQRGPPSSRSLEEPWWVSDPVDPWYLYEEEPGGWVDIDGITPSALTANTPLTFGATTTRGRDYPKVARTHDGSWNISFQELTSTLEDPMEFTFL